MDLEHRFAEEHLQELRDEADSIRQAREVRASTRRPSRGPVRRHVSTMLIAAGEALAR
jgi:hypothetical protein